MWALHHLITTVECVIWLIIDAYRDLAVAVKVAAQQGDQRAPRETRRALAEAARSWAQVQLHRYLLLYGTPVPGYVAPADTVPLARRVLSPSLEAWGQSADPQHISVSALRGGLVWWTRLHGLISLAVAGHFSLMGFDPALLYATEVDALLEGIDTGER